jgi:hypothetical protein
LVILGLLSTLIATTTTGVTLAIYHNSGDIYLDRSRPGFLPDEEEIEQDEKTPEVEEYEFQKDVVLDNEKIDDYLKHLQDEINSINAYEKPFGSDVLSDEHLGITKSKGETELTEEESERPVEDASNNAE